MAAGADKICVLGVANNGDVLSLLLAKILRMFTLKSTVKAINAARISN